ncbi:MAG: cation:proton antiporter [Tissierellia bacterium]|nr:cation:proton antiporter [Tissierellia bacterium]
MHTILKNFPIQTQIVLSIAIIILSGFLMTRITKKFKLPTVTGYILAGILIGPEMLHLVPRGIVHNLSFISDVALSFIAFDVGRYLKRKVLKSAGLKVLLLTICEALMAGVTVFVILYFFFHLEFHFALLLGAIATATAPASTMMTIKEYKAKGDFINTLLQVVAFDDVVCLLVFSAVIAIIQDHSGPMGIIKPVIFNIIAVVLGYVMGILLNYLLIPSRSQDNRLLLSLAILLLLTGFCQIVDVSPLLCCMVYGAGYRNRRTSSNLFRQLNSFTPPIMALFFIVSGMNLSLSALFSMKTIGIAYVLLRMMGKYAGAYLGGKALGYSPNVVKYLGLALAPQAGVALGLGFMGERLLGGELGSLFLNIILASSVLYEMIGPVLAKYAILHGSEKIEGNT